MNRRIIYFMAAALLIFSSCASLKGTVGRASNERETVANAAKDMLNRSYQYGSLDCSGLAQKAYSKAGISIPRTSSSQYSKSKKVGRSNLEKGDLVFFNTNGGGVSHVGVYIGGGVFIHAPKTGDSVRKDELENVYWKKVYMGAGHFF